MRYGYRAAVLCFAVSLLATIAFGQDSQSLGDAGRQARQKAKATQTQSKDATAKTPKVITNEDMPARYQPVAETTSVSQEPATNGAARSHDEKKIPGEQWKAQIVGQRNAVTNLESQIAQVSESVHFAGANCVSNCAQWNERQLQKQEQVDRMKKQLEEEKKKLGDLQDQARQQGYGSSVYDPD